MSNTTLTDEYMVAVNTFGCGFDDLETFSINGMKSAFVHYDKRCEMIYSRIKQGFHDLRNEAGLPPRRHYGETDQE
jgi:adenosine deaminase